MAARTDFFFRQRVQESELDLAFELMERADRDLAADLSVHGIISGAEPLPHDPVADLTMDLTAPARAYDHLRQRIFFGTGQRVDCSVDVVGLPTEVPVEGEERWLGVFLRFDRLLSDPRTDGNSQQVFFRRDEFFEIVVRQVSLATEIDLDDLERLLRQLTKLGELRNIRFYRDASPNPQHPFCHRSVRVAISLTGESLLHQLHKLAVLEQVLCAILLLDPIG